MSRLYHFAYTVCLLLWLNQTSSFKQLKPQPIGKSTLPKKLNEGLSKVPKLAPDNLLTKYGAIASLILSSLPLTANAAAGIPVGTFVNNSYMNFECLTIQNSIVSVVNLTAYVIYS
jgi:hypothetical protein